MLNRFVTLLEQERTKRDWSIRQLAKAMDVSHATLTNTLNGEYGPSPAICRAAADFLDLPADQVFRLAGLLPPEPERNPRVDELVHKFLALTDEDQERALAMVGALLEEGRRRNEESHTTPGLAHA